MASKGKEKPSEVAEELKSILKDSFVELSNSHVLGIVDPSERDGVFRKLWESSIDYVEQMDKLLDELKQSGRRGR